VSVNDYKITWLLCKLFSYVASFEAFVAVTFQVEILWAVTPSSVVVGSSSSFSKQGLGKTACSDIIS
jgi:hypothetical protein